MAPSTSGAAYPTRSSLRSRLCSAVRGIALWASDGTLIYGMPGSVQAIGGDRIGWFPYSYLVVLGLALVLLALTTTLVSGTLALRRRRQPRRCPPRGHSRQPRADHGVRAERARCRRRRTPHLRPHKRRVAQLSEQLAELDAIAAVIIGGAAFAGGRGQRGQRAGRGAHHRRDPQRARPAQRRRLLPADRDRRGDRDRGGGGRAARLPREPASGLPRQRGTHDRRSSDAPTSRHCRCAARRSASAR